MSYMLISNIKGQLFVQITNPEAVVIVTYSLNTAKPFRREKMNEMGYVLGPIDSRDESLWSAKIKIVLKFDSFTQKNVILENL